MEVNISFWFYRWKQRSIKTIYDLWDGIKNEIVTINGGKEGGYDKDFMKSNFDADANLPSNKLLKQHILKIVARSFLKENGKYYLQICLEKCLFKS